MQRIAFVLGKPPRASSIVAEVIADLRRAGHEVGIHLPHEEAEPAPPWLPDVDLVVQRGLDPPSLEALGRLEASGVRCCNGVRATIDAQDRGRMADRLAAAGVPVPATTAAGTWAEAVAAADGRPVVVKASLLGLLLASRVLRPLRWLADTARRISDTDLTKRIPVRGKGEASQIARAFNDMLARLELAFTAQRRFLDDAGHELRAPLTVIRGHLGLLELDTEPEERRATTALIIDEIDRMNRIVGDLLLLAAAEQPDFLVAGPLDLHDLTVGVYRRVSALANRDWRLEQTDHAAISADGQRLTQAMVQLAQNACQHTDEGAVIRIGSAASDGCVRLWVHDTGPGVPPEDATRIFRRFTRGAPGQGAGAGLGLSIVEAITEAHRGRVRLADTTAAGARFELIIPAAPPPRNAPISGTQPIAVSSPDITAPGATG